MKRSVYLILMLLAVVTARAQDKPQYAVFAIPDSMKKDANSVIRELSNVLVIKKPGKGKETIKKVVTVLNEKGDNELSFYSFYDKFQKIDDVEITIYDEFGRSIKRSRKKDLQHTSYDDGFSIAGDAKIISTKISTEKYPVTIEIKYEINYEGILDYDDFYPQVPGQSIQHAFYSITVDSSNKVRYKNYRCNISPAIKKEAGLITYIWEVKNMSPGETEPGSARTDKPRVQIAPSLFEMDDYPGDMSSWKGFGIWQNSLILQTNKLPEPQASYYRDLVKNASSDREKVKILYSHLQENYRYVSIQLGIGGLKPFPADFTEKKKYGDCKGLSNFMQAMLNAVNIKSHYAKINAGEDGMATDPDFPQSFSNHIVLCVPLQKDTVWLECTSRTQPFGVLGSFTENRNALLVTENGGVLVRTPRSTPEQNWLHAVSLITMDEDGSGKATIDINYGGEFASEFEAYVVEGNEQYKKSYLVHGVGLKQPDKFDVLKKNEQDATKGIRLELTYDKIPDFSAGSKHFLNARLYKFWSEALPQSKNRTNDYYFDHPFIKTDTTILQLPEGFIAENLPKPATFNFALGSFRSEYRFDTEKRQLITTCNMRMNSHIIPAKTYQDAAKFFSDVLNEQQQKIVIKKQ